MRLSLAHLCPPPVRGCAAADAPPTPTRPLPH
uniref:Uncharacterized protein n=1 Tax=Arundo donax TaxID=35708 RepID=A0A0A9B1C9_ARUDO